MRYTRFVVCLYLCSQFLLANPEYKRFSVELEGGMVWQSRNVVQIPNTSAGTRFSLVDLVGTGPLPWFRFYFKWNIASKHSLYILLAPLSYTKAGTFDTNINFCGETFQQGIATDATYKFNSWRIGYSYNLCQRQDRKCWLGFTAKIRDAKIRLRFYPTKTWSISAGYRTVEGGADITEVYNFAWIHYGLLSVLHQF